MSKLTLIILFITAISFQATAFEDCDFNSAFVYADISSIVENTETKQCSIFLTNIGEYQAGLKCPLPVDRVEREGVVVSAKLCKEFHTNFSQDQKLFQQFIRTYKDIIVISDDESFLKLSN